ncbi:nucleotidyltransferase [Anaeromicropila populeti]|uniref:tRNA(Met) cytidine acetate ligase n=1 Tax=Anaeromicropila populeti TaxID=37658 RepID=A0A1I6KI42_9FIRM|nr:nucleotidyltransferase [Anaeromicropila populeti]SFR90905.1 Predicted nucleotidyltransferase [Anaeromicropila populeti]
MKITGIVTEYNPFHNGHLYHLQETRRLTGADYVVVVMSGNFIQRGGPAFIDKYSRTRMALKAGADLVLELPVRYATSSAENFAKGSVAILNNLGNVSSLCFGSETGALDKLNKVAEFIVSDDKQYHQLIAESVKDGFSYPVARKKALLTCLGQSDDIPLNTMLEQPNNILGIEYLKALKIFNSTIKPFTMKRIANHYHDAELLQDMQETSINSATAIRQEYFKTETLYKLKTSLPGFVYEILSESEGKTYPVHEQDFSQMLYYKLRMLETSQLIEFLDVSEDLARGIKKELVNYQNYTDFAFCLKSKRYTLTRIYRTFMHILLGIKQNQFNPSDSRAFSPYLRVLGLKKSSSAILKEAKSSNFPIITKMADAKKILSKEAYSLLEEDIFASDIYNQVVYSKFNTKLPNEFLQSPVIL